MEDPEVTALDPFDLPEWLGVEPVTWTAEGSIGSAALLRGRLTGDTGDLACDILAGDLAYPTAVLAESWRHDAHQAWTHGQVLLVEREERPTLVVPGSAVTVEQVLEAVRRLASSVGASAERFAVTLRL